MRLPALSVLAICGFLLGACASTSPLPTPPILTVVPSAMLAPLPRITAPAAPTATSSQGLGLIQLSPSPTIVEPTPPFGAAKVDDDFLFGGTSPTCTLPCWQGLEIGQSSVADVQIMFEKAFGFDKANDLAGNATKDDLVPGYVATGNGWKLESGTPNGDSTGVFGIRLWLDERTHILEAMQLQGVSMRFEKYTSPSRVMQELGAPSAGLVSISRTQQSDTAIAFFVFVYYQQGITLQYIGIPLHVSLGNPSGVAQVCLNKLSIQYAHYDVRVILTRPVDGDLDSLSPIQHQLILADISSSIFNPQPFEAVFNLSLKDAADLVRERADTCIYGRPTE